MDAKKKTLALLASVSGVDLNGAGGTETSLFVVPDGKECIIDHVVAREFSAACTTAVVTFGVTGGSCDEFLGDQTLSNISGTGDYLLINPVPNATPPKAEILTDSDTFGVEITTAEGSALTCTMDVWGYLYDE